MTDNSGFTTKQIALTILPKPSAVLSILGSSFVAYVILCGSSSSRRTNSQKSTWLPRFCCGGRDDDDRRRILKVNQLLILIMSLSDTIFSICLFLGAWPIPDSLSDVFYGASGTRATCTAQGFVMLLSAPGVFVTNACLGVGYLLVIGYEWNEDKLRKRALPWFLASILIVSVVGAATALAMDLINGAPMWCWINSHPFRCTGSECERGRHADLYAWWLGFVPLWMCFAIAIVAMVAVYLKVSKVERKMARWNILLRLQQLCQQQQQPPLQQQPQHEEGSPSAAASTTKVASARAGTASSEKERTHSLSGGGEMTDETASSTLSAERCNEVEISVPFVSCEESTATSSPPTTTPAATTTANAVDSVTFGSLGGGGGRSSSSFRRSASSWHFFNGDPDRKSSQIATQAYLYTLAFFLTWIFGTVLRLLYVTKDCPPPYEVLICHAILNPLQGFFNALIYIRPRYLRNRRRHPEMSRLCAAMTIMD